MSESFMKKYSILAALLLAAPQGEIVAAESDSAAQSSTAVASGKKHAKAKSALCGLPNPQEHYAALTDANPRFLRPADVDRIAADEPLFCETRIALDSYVSRLIRLSGLDNQYDLSQKVEALTKAIDSLIENNSEESLAVPEIFEMKFKAVRKYLSKQEKELMFDLKSVPILKRIPD